MPDITLNISIDPRPIDRMMDRYIMSYASGFSWTRQYIHCDWYNLDDDRKDNKKIKRNYTYKEMLGKMGIDMDKFPIPKERSLIII